jgi:hypothetical protein
MNTFEDFVEYLVLGAVAFLSSSFAIYVVSPQGASILLERIEKTPTILGIVVPFMLFLGLVFHYISYAINRPLLHRRLLKSWSKHYENLPRLVNSIRGEIENHWNPSFVRTGTLATQVGDSLEWCRFFLLQRGSDELKRQNLRVFYMYRVSYGSFFPLLLLIASGLAGLLIPGRDKDFCAFVLIAATVLLIGAYIAARNTLKILWLYLAYSIEVLVQEHQDKVKTNEEPKKTRFWPFSSLFSI